MTRPGYYSDPVTGGTFERWWDGAAWLDETRPKGGPPIDLEVALPPPGRTDGSVPRALTVTGTDTVRGYDVGAYLGVVTGRSIAGTSMVRDLGAGLRDALGGRAEGYEEVLEAAEVEAMTRMRRAAAALGANGVLAVRLAYAVVRESMLMVVAQGTAVVLGDAQSSDEAPSQVDD